MLKFEQLHLLITLSKTGSIHKAADNLFISQPALSNSLKKLEAELGVTLFERTSKGLLPTKIGQEMILLAEKIIQDVNEFYFAANTYKWNCMTLEQKKNIYLYTEEFLYNYYLSDFFIAIQSDNSTLQTQVIKDAKKLKKIPSDCSDSHYFIFLEEVNHPLVLPDNFLKYKIVDISYAIKTSTLCSLYNHSVVFEEDLFLYPYAHLDTKTKFFRDFSDYLFKLKAIKPVFSSTTPMMVVNYMTKRPAWTLGLLFDQQIPKKEFFAASTETKTIRLQTNIPNQYRIILAAHENSSENVVNLLLHMIRNELLINAEIKNSKML